MSFRIDWQSQQLCRTFFFHLALLHGIQCSTTSYGQTTQQINITKAAAIISMSQQKTRENNKNSSEVFQISQFPLKNLPRGPAQRLLMLQLQSYSMYSMYMRGAHNMAVTLLRKKRRLDIRLVTSRLHPSFFFFPSQTRFQFFSVLLNYDTTH